MIDANLVSNLLAYIAQTTVITAAGLGLLAAIRLDSPAVRYHALRGLLVLCLVLPALQPRVQIPVPYLDTSAVDGLVPTDGDGGLRGGRGALVPRRQAASSWPALIGLLAALGVAARLAWMGIGVLRLRQLRRAGELAPDAGEHRELQTLIGTRATIRYVVRLGQPVTFGWRHPIVLLPESLLTMPPHIQRAVAAHELWHVRRLDWFWTVTEEVVRAAFWFHPAMWTLVSRIQSAREEVVDELTVLLLGSRRHYLDALVAFADERPLFAATAFARRRHLVRRILLLSKESVMSSRRIVLSCAVLAAALLATGWYSVQAFPLTESVQMPRDRVPPPPPPPPQKAVMTEEALQKAIQANPSATNYLKLAVFYWEMAFRDQTMSPPEKATFTTLGIQAADGALAQNPDYVDALIYKDILLRMQANQSTDAAERKRLIDDADRLRNRAIELRKGQPPPPPRSSDMPPPPPPPPPPGYEIDGEVPLRVGGNIKAPAKTRNVFPKYPPLAMQARVQGVVIVEATVDRDGRVRDARVLRSIPMLDQAAIDAVMQWEFEPTYLNGVPKPVILTVTVSFTLQ